MLFNLIIKKMKRLMMFLGFLFIPIMVFCQQDSISIGQPPMQDIWTIIINFKEWMATFSGVVVATTIFVSLLVGVLKVEKKLIKQFIAWGVAIILLVGTDLLNIGYAKDFPILLAVLHGFAAGLAANGFSTVEVWKSLLTAIEGWFKPKQ